jgi:adenylate cyclase class IV
MTEPTAEAEIKVAVTADEAAALPARLAAAGFAWRGDTALTDYYLDFTRSPAGEYDFRRLRDTGGEACTLTEKRWADAPDGTRVRLEDEHPVPRAACAALIAGVPPARVLRKRRVTYTGTVADSPATVVLDTLTLAGTDAVYLECEILTTPARAGAARAAITAWLSEALGLAPRAEAPSMLALLLRAQDAG